MLAWLSMGFEYSTYSAAKGRVAQSLVDRILATARARLSDPTLDAAQLANANGISERYLHKLFAARAMTPMAWVRKERLLRIDRELRGSHGGAYVEAIAQRHGFSDGSAFRRAYRRQFGHSARQTMKLV